jgi:hypothetical protein
MMLREEWGKSIKGELCRVRPKKNTLRDFFSYHLLAHPLAIRRSARSVSSYKRYAHTCRLRERGERNSCGMMILFYCWSPTRVVYISMDRYVCTTMIASLYNTELGYCSSGLGTDHHFPRDI